MAWAMFAAACGDAHWATLRWPSEGPGPRQPALATNEHGLAVAATRIDYEPEAVVVHLRVDNHGDVPLRIDRAAILLAWDTLEYPVEAPAPDHPEPEQIELAPGEGVELRLRYELGRALTGPGAQLVFRSLVRGGAAVVDLPRLELPAKVV